MEKKLMKRQLTVILKKIVRFSLTNLRRSEVAELKEEDMPMN
jgi:hypothetical protein